MARKLLSQIFDEISDAPTPEDKVMILQDPTHNTTVLRQLLLYAFDPAIKFDTAVPVYKENKETDGYSSNSLYAEYKRLYIFLDSYPKVTPKRKSEILGQILESIDRSDAILLTKIVSRNVGEFGLTTELINEAFPGLLKG